MLVPIKFYFLFLLNVKKANQKKTSCADNRDFPELKKLFFFFFLTTTRSKVLEARLGWAQPHQHTLFCLFDKRKRESWLHASSFILCKLGNIVKAKRKVTLYISVVRFQHFFHTKKKRVYFGWWHTERKRTKFLFCLDNFESFSSKKAAFKSFQLFIYGWKTFKKLIFFCLLPENITLILSCSYGCKAKKSWYVHENIFVTSVTCFTWFSHFFV